MSERHKHEWRPHPDNPMKVVCGCGAEQYKSKLSEKQLLELSKHERPVLTVKPTDLLMFVGKSYYTPESFIDESRRMGVCKRVPMIPRGVVSGESKVFLAHEYQTGETDDDNGKPIYQSKVFAWFTVRGIVHVVSAAVNIPEAFKERGITEWEYVDGGFGFSGERGCGSLTVGGTYLLSEEDMQKCMDLGESTTMQGQIEVIEPPIPIKLKRFRGYKHVIGDNILEALPEEMWYGEAHLIYIDNKKAMRRYKRRLRKWKEKQEEAEAVAR